MRIVGHLDMDAFFAAVEERDREWLHGKPIVVGADQKGGEGRGVVSTANYKAREYGVHSAMPISKAFKLCPRCIFLAGNFKKYTEVSDRIMKILRKFSQVVETAGVDEAYFILTSDVQGLSEVRLLKPPKSDFELWKEAKKIAKKIKDEILEKEKLTCSIGIGPNKLIAKIASDFKKPDGLTVVTGEGAENFLKFLPIRKVPGIGPKTEAKFLEKGIKIVKDLPSDLYERILHDDTPLVIEREAKSIGEEETFENDTRSSVLLLDTLGELCREARQRFDISKQKTFRTIVLKVRFHDFETKTRSRTFQKPASDFKILKSEVLRLFLPFLDRRENPKNKLFRLVGVRIEKLEQ